MEFASTRSTALEAAASLQHIFHVGIAVGAHPIRFEGAVAYIINEEDVEIVAETWKLAFKNPPPLAIVLVNGLPRGAVVEWHVIRGQKWSDEPKGPIVQFGRTNMEVTTIMDKLQKTTGYGVLCIVFGRADVVSQMKSRYGNVAIQSIPCKRVYSCLGSRITSHDSYTILVPG
jgi:hypothetical protein